VLGWFADASAVELRDSDAIVIGPRTRLRYRLRVTEGGDVYDVEQVAYFTLGADRILAADLLDSFDMRGRAGRAPEPEPIRVGWPPQCALPVAHT
jgi:hypothetical protein